VAVVGITRSRAEKVQSFVKKSGATYPIIADGDDTFDALRVRAVPVNLLVDGDRRIVAEGLGDIEKFLAADRRT
jgi:peroxiredoxin